MQSSSLLARPVYGLAQVDRLLALKAGTARRWLEGYMRQGKRYPPVVRLEPTGSDFVTWGDFVEARLLAEFREAGAPVVLMRPAIDRLREDFHPLYPLAHARPFLDVEGRELVLRAQEAVGLERRLQLVVVRSGQLLLTPAADRFARSADFEENTGEAVRIRPNTDVPDVVIDPLRQFGEPVVRSVPTDVIAEQVRAGDRIETIAELYDLTPEQVESAIRYELIRGRPTSETAA